MDSDLTAALTPEALGPPIARSLGLSAKAVVAALGQLASGSQPVFLAHYRQERVRGLALKELEWIQARGALAVAFAFRREQLRAELAAAGKLDARVTELLGTAETTPDLDDLRALIRGRKKGPATQARAEGLEALAQQLWAAGSTGPLAPAPRDDAAAEDAAPAADAEPLALAAAFVTETVADAETALAGARAICIDDMGADPGLRRALRDLALRQGKLVASVVEKKKDKAGRYGRLLDRPEPCAKASVGTVLALHRGEREGVISVRLEVSPEDVAAVMREQLGLAGEGPATAWLREVAAAAWNGPLSRGIAIGARKELKQRIDRRAIAEYGETLRPLLMAPAFGPRPVLAIDPGHQPGCRIAVLDGTGALLTSETLYPLTPKQQAPQTKARLVELIKEHGVEAVVVTNAAGGREVERLVREALREAGDLERVITTSIDADAPALYASSRAAKDELPKADAALRRAVSAGRRLQDPLWELCKLDPRKLGLGQFQHEVDAEEMRGALEQVISSCINEVSVDLNSASAERLARVCGLTVALAKAVVAHREQHGPFRTRGQLLDVPGIAGKAFEQSAGFIRVSDGDHALDRTSIHPERYGQVTQIARDLGVTSADLLTRPELLEGLDATKYVGTAGSTGEPLGEATWEAILAELRAPGRDPRPKFELVEFDSGLTSFDDLEVGMDLQGVVTHMAGFGVFVDVGLAHEGLVHVSEIAHGFISSPYDAVHVGQRVRGRVIEVDKERKRFSLSLRALLPRPERPPEAEGKGRGRRRKDDRGERSDGPPSKGKGRSGPPRGGTSGGGGGSRGPGKGTGPKPSKPDRVLGFRMDLSELADLLEKG
jgi:uncharacterized protein